MSFAGLNGTIPGLSVAVEVSSNTRLWCGGVGRGQCVRVWLLGCATAYALSLLREVFYGMQRDGSPASTVAPSPGAAEMHLKMTVRRH